MVTASVNSLYELNHTGVRLVDEKPEWVGTAEAAEMLDVSRTTIKNMIERGDLPAEKIPFGKQGGYIYRIKTEDLKGIQLRPRGPKPKTQL